MNAPHDSQQLAAWNEEMVLRYDIERYYKYSHPIVRWLERRRLCIVRRLADACKGERLLEVGCGAGHVLEQFPTCLRTGADLSPLMLQRTRRRLGSAIALVRASADALPFCDGAWDVVVCTEVIEHTLDPAAVVRELIRVAGPQGRVVVSIPNECFIDQTKRWLRRIPGLQRLLLNLADEKNEWHLHAFDLPLLRRIIAGQAELRRVHAIPNRFAPVRYVVELRVPVSALGG